MHVNEFIRDKTALMPVFDDLPEQVVIVTIL